MRVLYVIESRESERAEWRPWTFVVPLSRRADAEAQVELLNSREPKPTRFASTTRTFRLVEVPAGCPLCLEGAIGPVCEFHRIREEQGATTPAPATLVPMARTLQPAPRPRNLDGSFTSRKFAAQMASIGAIIRKARAEREEGGR